jgi:hypothetical protein
VGASAYAVLPLIRFSESEGRRLILRFGVSLLENCSLKPYQSDRDHSSPY